jgi:hypothetical protein
MAKFEIKVVGKRRETTDVKIFATALLDLIDHLSDADRQKMAAAGERALKTQANVKQSKGNAA